VVELCHLNSARAHIITLQVQLQRVTPEHAQDEVLAKLEHEKFVKRLENMELTIAQSRHLFATMDRKIAHLEARIENMRQQQRLPTQDASSLRAFSRNDRILKKRSKSRTAQKSIFKVRRGRSRNLQRTQHTFCTTISTDVQYHARTF
jgi:multidrug resistance efflux pump